MRVFWLYAAYAVLHENLPVNTVVFDDGFNIDLAALSICSLDALMLTASHVWLRFDMGSNPRHRTIP